jgi:hypothetical protein
MTAYGDEDTIARFVLCARRIAAHSLVRDWDELARHAQGSFSGQLDVSGAVSFTRQLPKDEEAFESLAARVRPLTLYGEPIHHAKVFAALQRLLELSAATTDEQRTRFERLRGAWQAAELQGRQVQGYAVQSMRRDGSDATPIVSDTQLAAGWLYADLVHADPTGPKQEALLFPLRERYAAAVRVFSRIAALAVSTLRLVEDLRDAGIISITEQKAWEQDVVVGASELVDEAKLLVAPPGTDMPDLGQAHFGLNDDWKPFTVTELLRHDPANHVHVVLSRPDGSVVADYEAAVAHRRVESEVLHWHVLVAGSVVLHFEFHIEDGMVARPAVARWTPFGSTNQLLLASNLLMLQMHEAETMAFEVAGERFIALSAPSLEDDALRHIEVHTETVADIAVMESLSGEECGPCNGPYDDLHRVRLRQARLVCEGHVVASIRKPLPTTVTTGNPPQVVVLKPGTVDVGGSRVATPLMFLRHPEMTSRDLGPAPETGPDARKFEVASPDGERFLAWCPHVREVAPNADLVKTTSWDLIGIDEETFPY